MAVLPRGQAQRSVTLHSPKTDTTPSLGRLLLQVSLNIMYNHMEQRSFKLTEPQVWAATLAPANCFCACAVLSRVPLHPLLMCSFFVVSRLFSVLASTCNNSSWRSWTALLTF